jgi:hypothetical protein
MEPRIRLAERQLERMRAMNAAYHRRFFADIRFSIVAELVLLTVGAAFNRWVFLAVPVVALIGACQTAFDASYLIFSRQYAARLERYLNTAVGEEVLVAHELEDAYLFPLDRPKVVTVALASPPTWFGFMTAFYTTIGVGVYLTGLFLSLQVLADQGSPLAAAAYLIPLTGLTLAALFFGAWWFVSGTGERRLSGVLDRSFPA